MTPFSSLKKYQRLLCHSYHLFKRKKSSLSSENCMRFTEQMRVVQQAIEKKDKSAVKDGSLKLSALSTQFFPKSSFEKAKNFVLSIGGALILAIIIRKMCFEPYKIPTGSMRPTLMEQDHLVVSKTPFGINIPLYRDHFLFSPDLVKRNGIVVFTGEGMDIRDVDTFDFYIFPSKKQYVKRMIGKPGDTLYFYGGLIYGIDKEGHDISRELQPEQLSKIEHIPFLQFEGKVTTGIHPDHGVYSPVTIRQMNMPVAKLSASPSNQVRGEMIVPSPSKEYKNLWGIGNFATSRIVTQDQAKRWSDTSSDLPEAAFYLEIKHSPCLNGGLVEKDMRGRLRPHLRLTSSFLPLNEEHMLKLFQNLYTVRFIVDNGIAYPYGLPAAYTKSPLLPKLSDVPNGTYEFYYGKGYKIGFQGLSFPLEENHPLYKAEPKRIQLLYNLGMEFDTRFSPTSRSTPFFPLRFVYFREGDLYAMGSPLLTKEDPVLLAFLHQEKTKTTPFIDAGAPVNPDGSVDSNYIKEHGIQVPDNMYLVLGDNHAVSADSRDFGFVPQENLRGAPDWIFWPFGPRFGSPNQPSYPLFVTPRMIVWSAVFICAGTAFLFYRRRNKLPKF